MFPDWTGETVVVVASGSSTPDAIKHLAGYKTVVINRSFELVPDADILYAADIGFWKLHPGALGFPGLKICPVDQIRYVSPRVRIVRILKIDGKSIHQMQREPVGVIGHGGNSGFQAVNLVAQFGASRILLVGFDYCGNHWHDDHDTRLGNPSVDNLRTWAERFDTQAGLLKSWSIDVVNLSDRSALRNYRRENSVVFSQTVASLQA